MNLTHLLKWFNNKIFSTPLDNYFFIFFFVGIYHIIYYVIINLYTYVDIKSEFIDVICNGQRIVIINFNGTCKIIFIEAINFCTHVGILKVNFIVD